MSAAYEFRKIYLDCVEPDGAVSVVYQSWVRLAGVGIARRSVERYGPDGVRSVVDLAPAAVEMWDRACGADEGIWVEVVQGAWAPPCPSPSAWATPVRSPRSCSRSSGTATSTARSSASTAPSGCRRSSAQLSGRGGVDAA